MYYCIMVEILFCREKKTFFLNTTNYSWDYKYSWHMQITGPKWPHVKPFYSLNIIILHHSITKTVEMVVKWSTQFTVTDLNLY